MSSVLGVFRAPDSVDIVVGTMLARVLRKLIMDPPVSYRSVVLVVNATRTWHEEGDSPALVRFGMKYRHVHSAVWV